MPQKRGAEESWKSSQEDVTLISRTSHQAHGLSPIWVLCCYILLTASPPLLSSPPLLPDRVGMLLTLFPPPQPGGAEGLGRQRMFVWFPWLLHCLLQ